MKLTYHGLRLSEWVIKKIPIGLSKGLGRAFGNFYYYAFPRKRRLVRRNMRRALGPRATEGEVRRTARRACLYYADYWIDILWLPTCTREFVLERFDKVGVENLYKAMEGGSGVLVVLPHYGSWEAGAVFLSSLAPFAAVAEVLKPPELFQLFVKAREGVGIRIFPYDGKPETRDAMVEALKGGTMLALLCDRDLKGSGVEVEFFGERTTLPPGPASLALRSGCPILCVNVRNLDHVGWLAHATEPIYVTDSGDRDKTIVDTMQKVAWRLEELIREDPAQWHMFMPAWPSDRE